MKKIKVARSFPIVGIGGSAGGLEAFQELLKNLSAKPGMALVFIMHLAPAHKSLLPELLARLTKMPVSEIKSGMPLEINHVYVKPPNTNLSIASGKLILSKRKDINFKHMPIDYFFRSLAEGQGNRSIGVILSGTATDGTLGAGAIKAGGGVVFAQDEKSAAYNDMPQSAITAGWADFVFPPKKIASELERIAKHPLISSAAIVKADKSIITEDKGLESIFDILRSAKGLDFTYYKTPTVRRRISRRMILLKLGNLKTYIKFLREHKNEVEKLYEDLLINVTNFFRDPKAFQALEKLVLPAVIKNKAKDQCVRIWIPGCSSGEEAYSIAICLIEALGKNQARVPIQIFATDVSENGINRARRGIYGKNIKDNVTPERLKRFFTKEGNSYKISKQLREVCIFSKHNVFSDPPFSNMDIISCRNLLIYLQPVSQKKVFRNFHYGLRPGGFLFLGNSESASGYSNLFKTLDKKQRIFVKKYIPIELKAEFEQKIYMPKKLESNRKEDIKTGRETDIKGLIDRSLLGKYAPCGALIDSDMQVVQFRGHTGRFLESSEGRPSLDIFKLAREGLFLTLRAAIYKAGKTKHTVKREAVDVKHNGHSMRVIITVIPLKSEVLKEEFFLVLFDEIGRVAEPKNLVKAAGGLSLKGKSIKGHEYINNLRKELAETKEYLQTVIEEHENAIEEVKVANEEIMSSNEELQSTNEELETAKEELQSSNEELITSNEELQNRNTEISVLNNDLTNLFSSIDMPVIMMGTDLVIRRITTQAKKIFNITSSDIDKSISKIKLNIDIPDLEKTLMDVMESLHPKMFEIKNKEGNWYSVHIRPYRTIDNKIDGVVAIFDDITERKKAESSVADGAWQLQRIIASVGDGITLSDKDGHFEIFSPKMQELTGYTFGEAAASSDFSALIYPEPEARKKALAALDEVKAVGHHEAETVIRVKDGTEKILLVATSLMSYKGCDMFLSVYHDITEHRRLEDELLQARERQFKVLIENLPGKVFLKDRNSVYISCNENYARDLKIKPEEIAKKTDYDFFPAHLAEKYRADDKRVMESGKTEDIEEEYITIEDSSGNSQKSIINTVKAPVRDKAGKVMGLFGLFWNITERKKAEETLRVNEMLKRLDQIKSDFVSTVSHELRTPLTTMKEFTSIILDEIPGKLTKEQKKYVEIIKGNIDRLARLINNLLDISKIESGRVELKKAFVDIINLANSVIYTLKSEAEEKHIEVKTLFPAAALNVYADPDKVIQILTNLIGNAIKFTKENGKITVEIKDAEKEVECSVTDTGVGIAQENMGKVFTKFQQFDRVAGAGAKGTGLGLAITKELIQRHNGKIWVESKLDKGSKFIFTLPKHSKEYIMRETVEEKITEAREKNKEFSIFIIKLDDYSEFEEELGKDKAQKVFLPALTGLEDVMRREGFLTIRSENEVIVLAQVNKQEASGISARFKRKMKEHIFKIDAQLKKGFSYGYATYPDDADNAKDLLDEIYKSCVQEREERLKKTIMIVDDEPELRGLLKKNLQASGYSNFSEAGDGNEALEKIKTAIPDLLILDLTMPRMSGYEVIGILKEDTRTKDIPVLIMSGYAVEIDKLEEYVKKKAIPVVGKPFDIEQLKKLINYLL